jgi:IS4 transposase
MPNDPDDMLLPFALPSLCQKKVTAAFDGGRISSDGGVLLLAGADKRLGLIDTLAGLIPDHRDQAQITHTIADILRARIFAIACGYPDADDLDDLRKDPAFKFACGRRPETGDDLASQPTISRWENAPEAVKDYPAVEALAAYRLRWQIGLAFKRLKSLLHIDALLARSDRGARSWLYPHLILALLCNDLSRAFLESFPSGPF